MVTAENRQATRRREAIMQAVIAESHMVLAESERLVVIAQKLYERVLEALGEEDETPLSSDHSWPAATTR